jgi:hypothetical protein
VAQTIAPSKGRKSKAATLLEAQRALEMHVAGVEDVHICQELGISRATLYRRMQWARSVVLEPLVEEYRQEATARAREGRRRIYAQLNATRILTDPLTGVILRDDDGEPIRVPVCTPGEVAALQGRLVQWDDFEAKIRGGYAPTQVNVQHTVRNAFDTLLEELAANDPRRDTGEHAMSDNIRAEIAAERERQLAKGYTPEHDDEHGAAILAEFASEYIGRAIRHGNRSDLIKAAALLESATASLDRLLSFDGVRHG